MVDVAASYPNCSDFENISAETTYRELSKFDGCTEWERRRIGINLTGGPVNATEFCRLVYKLPNYETLANAFAQEHNLQSKSIEIRSAA